MLEALFQLRCDGCGELFLGPLKDEDGGKVRLLLLTAELAGWKVNRLARDVYYGKAWCIACKPTKSTPSGPPSSGPT
jgi:hypothetical protein